LPVPPHYDIITEFSPLALQFSTTTLSRELQTHLLPRLYIAPPLSESIVTV
jgi:hypothetical protein